MSNNPAATGSTSGNLPRHSVVFLPGIDGTGQLLFAQKKLLAEHDVQCASYPQDRSQTYDDLIARAVALIEKAESRPVDILAESFGGTVALTLALNRPELVRSLILVNTFAWFPRRLRITVGAALSWLYPPWGISGMLRRMRRGWLTKGPLPEETIRDWFGREGSVPLRAYGHRLRLIAPLDLRPRLKEIACPAVVVISPPDRIVPPSCGYELARLLPRAKRIEVDTGHLAMMHPGIDVTQWLAEVDRMLAAGK